ncbi:MAG: hypothetical protein KatS3mg108_0936 [Isosphaeraceae bacterium]|jgi:hypothetical protein|nr:MAG: hypothetical protein KatS3mg108_0936 [Isosphaeraceae bacterium]
MKSPAAELIRSLARRWRGHLAHYRQHRNPEHLEALFEEVVRFAGFQLELDLDHSPYWSRQPLWRRALVILYLVDRGILLRQVENGRTQILATPDAEAWIDRQPSLAPYRIPTRELVAAIRNHQRRRNAP